MKILKRSLIVFLVIVVALVAYYRIWFLRMPDRNIPNNSSVFVAPANGVVVSVNRWDAASLTILIKQFGIINVWTKDVDTAGTIISIQMDPTNVHFQRAPIAGKVVSERYTKGNFNNAVVMSNTFGIRFENEHNEFLMETATGKKYKVIQIAGFVARRIVDFTHPNQEVKQGAVIGLIKLGSQVTIILPHDVTVLAKKGDITIDGETVIATQ